VIEDACGNYENISAGVIVTMGDGFTEHFTAERIKMEEKLNIPIVEIGKQQLLSLFLKHFQDFSEPATGVALAAAS
jgi:hypothetical protein